MKGKGGFKAWATNGLVRLVIRCTEQKIAGMISLLLYVHQVVFQETLFFDFFTPKAFSVQFLSMRSKLS